MKVSEVKSLELYKKDWEYVETGLYVSPDGEMVTLDRCRIYDTGKGRLRIASKTKTVFEVRSSEHGELMFKSCRGEDRDRIDDMQRKANEFVEKHIGIEKPSWKMSTSRVR